MIPIQQLQQLKEWFNHYVKTFYSGNPKYNKDIELKVLHTYEVCKEMKNLCNSLSLTVEQTNIAYIIALLHDIGRFEQYKQFQTYHDIISVNHSALGIQVIEDLQVLKDIPPETAAVIKRSVANHNHLSLPENEDQEILLFTKLIRDADKLDIYRVCCNEYKNNIYDPIISLGLPDVPEVSDIVFEQLMNEESVLYKELKTYTDFKLIKFGWLADINFHYTFKMIKERGYLEIILQSMPQTEKILMIYNKYNALLEEKCAEAI